MEITLNRKILYYSPEDKFGKIVLKENGKCHIELFYVWDLHDEKPTLFSEFDTVEDALKDIDTGKLKKNSFSLRIIEIKYTV